ncbi:hypothetical protein Dcar01_02571 [Deinococcus carri]|uniref:Transposase n=1 Tax=Deinococcus carri TaxID=1211323 RepID=A0ABP9W8Z5_9DEIO
MESGADRLHIPQQSGKHRKAAPYREIRMLSSSLCSDFKTFWNPYEAPS